MASEPDKEGNRQDAGDVHRGVLGRSKHQAHASLLNVQKQLILPRGSSGVATGLYVTLSTLLFSFRSLPDSNREAFAVARWLTCRVQPQLLAPRVPTASAMAPSVAAPVPPAPVAPLTTPADVPPNGDVGRKRDQNVQPAAAASAALPASPANKGAAADPNNDVPPTPYDKPPTEKDGAPSPRDTEAATAAAAPAPAPAAAPSAALQPVPDSTCEAKGTARPTKQAPAGSSTPTQRSPVVQAASAAAPIPWSVHQLLYRRPGPLQLRGIVDTNVFERNMPLLMDMVAACKKDIKECKLLLPIQVKEELQAHKRPINGKKQQLQNDAGLALYHITEARKDGVLEEQAEHDLPKKHLKDGTRRMSGDLGILQAMGFALDKGQVPFLVSDDKLLRLLVINYGFRAYASSVFERTALPVLDLQGPDAFFDWLA